MTQLIGYLAANFSFSQVAGGTEQQVGVVVRYRRITDDRECGQDGESLT